MDKVTNHTVVPRLLLEGLSSFSSTLSDSAFKAPVKHLTLKHPDSLSHKLPKNSFFDEKANDSPKKTLSACLNRNGLHSAAKETSPEKGHCDEYISSPATSDSSAGSPFEKAEENTLDVRTGKKALDLLKSSEKS